MTANFDCYNQSKLLLCSQNPSEIEPDNPAHTSSQPLPSNNGVRSSTRYSTSAVSEYDAHVTYPQTPVEGNSTSLDEIESKHLDGSLHTAATAPQPPQSSSKAFRYLAHVWRWELFTWLLGTVGFMANMALLVGFNGVQQQYWKSNVQITAFVAALAQLSQSALLVPVASSIGQSKWKWLQKERRAVDIEKFDLASRGPDGAMRLLWHLRLRPHLVSLGALSTILMLAFPTFVQQSVAVNGRRVEFHGENPTYIKRASQVSASSIQLFGPNQENSGSVAIFLALMSEYINPANITGACTTESCTWEPYTTLAICARTEDVSGNLTHGDVNGNVISPPRLLDHDHFPSFQPNTTLYTYTEGAGNLYGDLYDYGNLPADGSPAPLPTYPNLYMVFYNPCKPDDQDLSTPFDVQDVARWTALEASFYPCVQVFNTTYETSWQSSITPLSENLQWYTTGKDSLSFCTWVPSSSEEMCVSSELLFTIGEALRATYSFSGTRSESCYTDTDGTRICRNPVELLGESSSVWSSISHGDIRSNLENTDECNKEAFQRFDNRMQNIAASLSIEIRRNEKSRESTVQGTAWIIQPTIEVTFMWLMMPLVLYLGITSFFFATMIRTAFAPPWKSSPLALLRCADPNNKIATMKQFEIFAKSTNIRLEDNGETWHLVGSGYTDNVSADEGLTQE